MQSERQTLGIHKVLALLVCVVGQCLPMMACDNTQDRAADENMEQSGWQERGRNPGDYTLVTGGGPGGGGGVVPGSRGGVWQYELSYTDVIISPDGQFLLGMAPVPGPGEGFSDPGLALVVQPLPAGPQLVFPTIRDLRRINFSPDGRDAYLLDSTGTRVSVFSLETFEILGAYEMHEPGKSMRAYSVLDVTPDGRYLVASNLPTTDVEEIFFDDTNCGGAFAEGNRCRVHLVDMLSGLQHTLMLDQPVRDIDFGPYGELLLTASHPNFDLDINVATIWFVDPATGTVLKELDFPNCADELKLQPGGTLALLSPTTCRAPSTLSQDPISVIDLNTRTFLGNLPGFGPVTISEDGSTAVGFTRKDDMLQAWNYSQVAEVGLIQVDLGTLEWSVIEYGDEEPGYLLAPDGHTLYTYEETTVCQSTRHTDNSWHSECEPGPANLTRIDLTLGMKVPVAGPQARLRHFVITPDKSTLYALNRDHQLIALPFGSAMTAQVPLPLGASPDLMNIRKQGDLIVLGYSTAPQFHVLSVQDLVVIQTLTLTVE